MPGNAGAWERLAGSPSVTGSTVAALLTRDILCPMVGIWTRSNSSRLD